ncbi:hypothetical protein KI387_017704, partial [Taxus chinensis]
QNVKKILGEVKQADAVPPVAQVNKRAIQSKEQKQKPKEEPKKEPAKPKVEDPPGRGGGRGTEAEA